MCVDGDVGIVKNDVLLCPSKRRRALIFCKECYGIIKYARPSEMLATPGCKEVEVELNGGCIAKMVGIVDVTNSCVNGESLCKGVKIGKVLESGVS